MRIPSLFLASAALAFLAATATANVETYKIDPVHSSVGFRIRHFFTSVPGSFTKFQGTIVADRDNLENSTINATIDVPSIDTRIARRDADLRSDHFFAADKYPTITFKSTKWMKTGDATYDVEGELTIRGVAKQVTLHVKSLGFGMGMMGHRISGWSAETTLDRNDFGITAYPKMLGENVPVTIEIEADLVRSGRG